MAFLPPGFLPHLAALENAANEEEAAHNYWVQRKRLRDACNPFDIPQAIFKQNFRLDKERAHSLIDKLTPLMQTQRAFSLTATQKVSAKLNMFYFAFHCCHKLSFYIIIILLIKGFSKVQSTSLIKILTFRCLLVLAALRRRGYMTW